jgi:hypothetical protein
MSAGKDNNWTLPLVLFPVWVACTLAAIPFGGSSLILVLLPITTALLGCTAAFSMPDSYRAMKLPIYLICALLAVFEGFALHIQTVEKPKIVLKAAVMPLALQDQPALLADLFKTDFSGMIKFSFDTDNTIRNNETGRAVTGHVYSAVYADVRAGAKFYSFYIPRVQEDDVSYQLAKSLADAPGFVDAQLRNEIRATPHNPADPDWVKLEILPFSRVTYVYHENPYSTDQIRALTERFAKTGLQLHLRDKSYATDRWTAWKTAAPRPL